MGAATVVKVGSLVPLSVVLNDGATDKFVRATVRDHSGGTVSGSPFSLNHVGNGTYQNGNLGMPNVPYIVATYEVFDDAGFTTPADYDAGGASFNRDDGADANVTVVQPSNVKVDVDMEPGVDVLAVDDENNTVIATKDDAIVEVKQTDNNVSVEIDATTDGEVVVLAEEGEAP